MCDQSTAVVIGIFKMENKKVELQRSTCVQAAVQFTSERAVRLSLV
jgi:hypothetical protein